MKKNWTVETIGHGLYVLVINFEATNLVYNAMYYQELYTDKKTNSHAIGRWKPKTIKQ